jgi:RNA polymerase sigma-70 factor (ECF subfamily)
MKLAAAGLATEIELIDAVKNRREEALAEVYRRHAASVYGLALRVTRNQTLAEEVTQEVFVRLWRDPSKFDPSRGTIRSFLLAHTHGRAVDLIRAEASRRMRDDREARLVAESGPSLDEEVVEMQIAEQVRRALGGLNPLERDAIELAYFGGHSYREVARILGQPEGTVKSRIRSGLARLNEQLRSLGLAPE